MLVCVFFAQFCTRDRGCSAHRASRALSDLKARKCTQTPGRIAPRERGVMRGDLPSLRAPLRVAGRGRGWGVYQLARLAASLLRHPPPPTPKSELRSSRPHRFAGGGEEMFAMAGCLKIETQPSSPGIAVRLSSRRLLAGRIEPGIDATLEARERFQALVVGERQELHQDHATDVARR